jgi:hypothetical protein
VREFVIGALSAAILAVGGWLALESLDPGPPVAGGLPAPVRLAGPV